ncbi:LLM class F420-dependent oxidoreductase [Amycolatopsis sp. PS_44_ISF1]|uniref:LLM class F420-dependent oxidoreductase n=1 Tax=Amycolatopsis sp. PS_44_ISF1 TaxID=2974917 RepID=UPI0028DEAFA2|nr:LLM class F420-dependent oxidoreductase [Amycolatopsis sp. PS_44_ISF1]MDT8912826.1 LLM class F420-dependent oxidoreductase [Amycolatopsis sp. PS_44_ISF1]
MQIGLSLRYAGPAGFAGDLALARRAEELGYSVVWAAEAYGTDAVTVLSWIAAHTGRIGVGSAVLQIPARTPAMTGMTAATLDTLSGGRFRLGLGVSGPQVSEGWHGVRFADPLGRTREYVEIVRAVQSRRRVRFAGGHFTLPLPDGPGTELGLSFRPERRQVPVYLAAIGPANLALTGAIADGWLPVFFSPEHAGEQLARIRAGAERAGRTLSGFDVAPLVPLVVGEDWRTCADEVRAHAALYLGGMGSREQNFYNGLAARMGFEGAAAEVQEKYLARDYEGAKAAVPLELLDATSLLGPVDRIVGRMAEFAGAGVTTLSVTPFGRAGGHGAALTAAAEAYERAGVA